MKPRRPKKLLKTRDHLMVKVINGATKASVHVDRRKKAAKEACRKPVDNTGEEGAS